MCPYMAGGRSRQGSFKAGTTVDGYNERVHRKKQRASSIHTIPSTNIAFIQVFFFELRNSMQYRSLTFTFAKRQIQSNIVHKTHSFLGSFEHK